MPTPLKKKNHQKGFTLIELMVSSAIFIIVMVISIGAVLSIVDTNRKAQALNSVMTNLSFVVESMVRDMREGYNYCQPYGCTPTSGNGGFSASGISFKNSIGNTVTYNLSGNSITKQVIDAVSGISSGQSQITAPEVSIQNMQFYVTGNAIADGKQPTILLVIQGLAGVSAKTQSTFRIETLISQRLLDT